MEDDNAFIIFIIILVIIIVSAILHSSSPKNNTTISWENMKKTNPSVILFYLILLSVPIVFLLNVDWGWYDLDNDSSINNYLFLISTLTAIAIFSKKFPFFENTSLVYPVLFCICAVLSNPIPFVKIEFGRPDEINIVSIGYMLIYVVYFIDRLRCRKKTKEKP